MDLSSDSDDSEWINIPGESEGPSRSEESSWSFPIPKTNRAVKEFEESSLKGKGTKKRLRKEREALHKVHLLLLLWVFIIRVRQVRFLIPWRGAVSLVPKNLYDEALSYSLERGSSGAIRDAVKFVDLLRRLVLWWHQEFETDQTVSSPKYTGAAGIAREFKDFLESKSMNIPGKISTECSTFVFLSAMKHLKLRSRLVAALYPIQLSLSKEVLQGTPLSIDSISKVPRRGFSTKLLKKLKSEGTLRAKYVTRDVNHVSAYSKGLIDIPQDTLHSDTCNTKQSNEAPGHTYPFYFWCEIFCPFTNVWVPCDPVRNLVKDHSLFEPHPTADLKYQFSYIVSNEPPYMVRDVTSDYTSRWGSMTSRLRVKSDTANLKNDWWYNTLDIINRKIRAVPEHDSDTLHRMNSEAMIKSRMNEVMPTNLAGFLNHPLYVLECQLKKNEIIYPMKPEDCIGVFRDKRVYPRSSVQKLNTKNSWIKQGRIIIEGEKPIKVVPVRSMTINRKRRIAFEGEDCGNMDKEELFALYQTKEYVAESLIDAKVPKNRWGNFELFHPNMLPKNAAYITYSGAEKIIKRLKISYAPAVVGFEYTAGKSNPIMKGIVIPKEYLSIVAKECLTAKYQSEKAEAKRKKERIIKMWRNAILYITNKNRLYSRYTREKLEEERVNLMFSSSKTQNESHNNSSDHESDLGDIIQG